MKNDIFYKMRKFLCLILSFILVVTGIPALCEGRYLAPPTGIQIVDFPNDDIKTIWNPASFKNLLQEGRLILDGTMGTEVLDIQTNNLGIKKLPVREMLGILYPELLEQIYRHYITAGAAAITTQTFTVNSTNKKLIDFAKEEGISVDELCTNIISNAVKIAKETAGIGGQKVIGSIGPTGKTCNIVNGPFDLPADHKEILTPDDFFDIYTKVAQAMIDAGVDAILCETFFSLDDLVAAIKAIQSISPNIPIMATMAFDVNPDFEFLDSSPFDVISIYFFKKEHTQEYRLINDILIKHDITDISEVTPKQLISIFNKLIKIPLLQGLLDSNSSIPKNQEIEKDPEIIRANKQKIAAIYPRAFGKREYQTAGYGVTPAEMVKKVESLGVAALGANCGMFGDTSEEFSKNFLKLAAKFCELTDMPIIMQPNAGNPKIQQNEDKYPINPVEYSELMKQLFEIGVNVIKGCCGVGPEYVTEYIRAIQQDELDVITLSDYINDQLVELDLRIKHGNDQSQYYQTYFVSPILIKNVMQAMGITTVDELNKDKELLVIFASNVARIKDHFAESIKGNVGCDLYCQIIQIYFKKPGITLNSVVLQIKDRCSKSM